MSAVLHASLMPFFVTEEGEQRILGVRVVLHKLYAIEQ